MEKNNICIIGAGRVGTTIASKLAIQSDPVYMLYSVSSRSKSSLDRAESAIKKDTSSVRFTLNNREAVKGCNIIMICTPDDTIKDVCDEIFGKKGVFKDTDKITVIHFSGSKTLRVLSKARETGAHTASIHPMKSFASIESALKTLEGTIFGVTFSDKFSEKVSSGLIALFGGKPVVIDDDKKTLYHASACIASNYLVSLIDLAVRIFSLTGASEEEALEGLSGLIEGTVKNIKTLGTKQALTGPIARGDINTIKEHLKDLKRHADLDDIIAYKAMAVETSKIAIYNNWIKEDVFRELISLTKQGVVKDNG